MSEPTLKNKASNGIIWSMIEKIAMNSGQLIIGIILARILMPKDFGLIGMLSIFITLSESFIDSGMGSGLIQKKNRSEIDFSTVFVFNLFVSLFLYLTLFFFAPLIANFYKVPKLETLIRVLSINIIINSLSIIQRTKLIIDINFKKIAKVNITSILTGGITAIFFAYWGWGIWSLVIQKLITSIITVIMFWTVSKWRFSILFAKKSFKNLFGFGSKLLIARLYAQTFNELYNIVIGKVYSATELGFYTRAKSFADLTSGSITSILQQVTYPILSSLQDDKKKMISVYRRLIKMTSFFVFPAMTLLSLLSEPIIKLLLTDKWESVIVLLQWMSFARFFYPISAINMNILNAIGRSDLFLKVDLSKLPLVILSLIITIPLGVKAIIIGHVVTSVISFFINAYMPGKMFGYGALKQLKDMIPIFIATSIMALLVTILIPFINNILLKLILGGVLGVSSYLLICSFLKIDELKEIKELLSKFKNKF